MSKLYIAVATMVGSIIGAGVLGLPYVFSQAGLVSGIAHVLGIGLLLMIVNLALGEIILRTKGNHQLSGYAEKYLGKRGKLLITLTILVQLYGALIAYTLGEGTSMTNLIGGSSIVYSFVFFVLLSVLAYRGLKAVGFAEIILITGLGAVVLLVSFLGIPHMTNTIPAFGSNPFMPFGIVLFSLYGVSSVPLVKELMNRDKKHMKHAIVLGSIIPALVYILFALVVASIVGVDGFNALSMDDRIASAALQQTVDGALSFLTLLFGIVAMGTSFLVSVIVVQEIFQYDYGWSKDKAFGIAIIPPLLVVIIDAFIVDIANFISVLGITGALGGSITAILILGAYFSARRNGDRKPEYSMHFGHVIIGVLVALFAIGSIMQIASLF